LVEPADGWESEVRKDRVVAPNGYWEAEKVFEVSRTCETVADFRRNFKTAYRAAQRLGILYEACAHMEKGPRVRRDDDYLSAEAKKYKSRGDFSNGSPTAYNLARRRGILDDICAHMGEKSRQPHDRSGLMEIAQRFQIRGDFKREAPGAYKAACKLGILDDICAHMDHPRLWTRERAVEASKIYATRTDFSKGNQPAYNFARKIPGLLDELFPKKGS
jgi:hypothetical protein